MDRVKGPGADSAPGAHRRHHWAKLVAAALAGLVLGMSAILFLDAERSAAIDELDGPTTNIVDHVITWAEYPQRAAKRHSVDPAQVQQCREARFIVITFSGTGMEASHYQANTIQSPVEDLGGCVMYHWYGHTYDAAASARSVVEAVGAITPRGQSKRVFFLGASFGGIAAEDIASDPAVAGSPVIDLARIIMIATPVDMNDVIQDVFGVPVPLIKNLPVGIPRFGGLVVLGNAINGQRQRGDLGDPVEWRMTFTNAAKTRPVLLWSELERMRQGMLKVRPEVPVDYLGSPDSDLTVDTDRAYGRIDNVILAETRYFTIHDGGHDLGWLMASSSIYNDKLIPIFREESPPA